MKISEPLQIDHADSLLFAQLSGDRNVLHVDCVRARRSIFGGTVTHGVHVLLAALEKTLARSNVTSISSLSATFDAPVRTGESFRVETLEEGDQKWTIQVRTKRRIAQRIKVSLGDVSPVLSSLTPASANYYSACRELDFEHAEGYSGAIPIGFDISAANSLFPVLSRMLPALQLATIATTSRIVGMECPGRDSVFVGLKLAFDSQVATFDARICFNVIKHDARFKLVTLNVGGPGISGQIQAVFRARMVSQASYQEVVERVHPAQFRDRRALVIGGSRGLGELTAKILSAGGADVVISYATGEEDARNVASEIAFGRGRCSIVKYDVLDDGTDLCSQLPSGWSPTHLYFFASPFIENNPTHFWDENLFNKFCSYYVSGFSRCVGHALEGIAKTDQLVVFNPSTVFVSQPEAGFAEYAVAKAASEAISRTIAGSRPNVKFQVRRLPRLLTDQTASVSARIKTSALMELLVILAACE